MSKIEVNQIDTISGSSTLLVGPSAATKLTFSSTLTVDFNVNSPGVTLNDTMKNTPVFYGQLASSQVVSRGVQTKLTGMTAQEIDTDSAFNGTTFTVPSGKNGYYFIYAGLFANFSDCGNDGELIQLNIFKNGSSFKELKHESVVNNQFKYFDIYFGLTMNLSVGDTIEAYIVLQDASANPGMKAQQDQTFLGGYRLIGA